MTEKEFRKLRSLDLIQILLTQSNEEVRLQEELDRQTEHLEGLHAHNENLKTALNDKDALIEKLKQDLNQSDAAIHSLREELKALYTDKRINLENIGSLTEVAKRVNQIFEKAQREAEEYLAHPENIYAIEENTCQNEVARNPGSSVIDSIDTDDIKVEVAINNAETEDHIASESVIFEASVSPAETAVSEPETVENTDEVLNVAEESAESSIEEVVTAEAENEPVESVTPDPADSDACIAEASACDKNAELHPVKTTSTNSRQNKSLFRKFIGGIKREKGGK
ncbi:MAG: hypothetical protein HFG92_18240 [Dorea sp.]|jgi:hypothetical protein|nr:hypothetical protein [Dorea sp.]